MNNSLTPLSGEQVNLLKKSFRQLDTERTAASFYAKLFDRYPFVKPLFPTDMRELGMKLMSVFELIVFSFEEAKHNEYRLQPAMILPLRELGRKHDQKGVLDEYYKIANSLLLETISEQLGTSFTEAVYQSWKLALEHLSVAMLDKSIKPSQKLVDESGSTLRETFSYIKKLFVKPTVL